MTTLLYSPGVEILVTTRTQGILDVTADIERGSLTLNENQPHQLSFELSNPGAKYNNVFTPDDRVIVRMKRLTWLQTFSGFLDQVPYFSVYPRSVRLLATCTSKLIKYHYWDAGDQWVVNLLQEALNQTETGEIKSPDGGMANVINQVLQQVIGWPANNIHIGTIPKDWMTTVMGAYDALSSELAAQQGTLNAGGLVVAGQSGLTTGSSLPPAWGPYTAATIPQGTSLPAVSGTATMYGPTITQGGINALGVQGAIAPLNPPDDWYLAAHWSYYTLPGSQWGAAKAYLAGKTGNGLKILVQNTQTGAIVCCRAADTEEATGRCVDLSYTAFNALAQTPGISGQKLNPEGTMQVNVAWAPLTTPVGPYTAPAATTTTGSFVGNGALLHDQEVLSKQAGLNGSPPATTSLATTGGIEAANAAITQLGVPYGKGGGHGGTGGPGKFWDCSGLVGWAWAQAGITTIQGLTAAAQMRVCGNNLIQTQLRPGDLVFAPGADGTLTSPGHVGMLIDNGATVIQAPETGENVDTISLASFTQFAGGLCGYGRPPKSTAGTGVVTGVSGVTLTRKGSTTTGQAAFGNLRTPAWVPQAATPTTLAQQLTGARSMLIDTSMLSMIDNLVSVGMRSWCTAPNGDFISWFPDYFGIYNYASKMTISTLELQDFDVVWSDAQLVTHQFTAAPSALGVNDSLDPAQGQSLQLSDYLSTYGIATIDMPQLFQALFNIQPTESTKGGLFSDANAIYQQFGARPNFEPLPLTYGFEQEFWWAVRLWMQNWASQFTATVPLSFMPELWPGMLIVLEEFGFQAYVNSVTHTWDFVQGGGFSTGVSISAPSATDGSGLIGLARGA